MKKALGALVLVTGLVVVAGCARSERWTLDGSKPGPLDDSKRARSEVHMTKPAEKPAAAVVSTNVDVVTENDNAVVRNKGDEPMVATVQVTPGQKNMPRESAREMQVLVPAKSDVRLGRTTDGGDGTWSYRLVHVTCP